MPTVPGPLISFPCLPADLIQTSWRCSLVPFPAMDEKAILHVSLGRTDWWSVVCTGIRGSYSDSFVNTDLDLVMDVTTLPRAMIHSLEATNFQSLSLHVSGSPSGQQLQIRLVLLPLNTPLCVSQDCHVYTFPRPLRAPSQQFPCPFSRRGGRNDHICSPPAFKL